jgi:hypothetical protein
MDVDELTTQVVDERPGAVALLEEPDHVGLAI